MEKFKNSEGKSILKAMVAAVQQQKEYLSEVDGLIGDGDHGANMNKGFTVFEERFLKQKTDFLQGLENLGDILFQEIGGSMGPIYGTLFCGMADGGQKVNEIGLSDLTEMVNKGYEELGNIIEAKPGDKTIIDTLYPALISLKESEREEIPFEDALKRMEIAAENGKNATKAMQAKYGRSSRLGERSIGNLDAGAVSCCIILTSMAEAIIDLLGKAV